jgi:D-glycero-alpha-D-manno-heptose-7-phosphate kinase
VDSVDKIEHPSVREALKMLGIDGGIEILSISDIPSGGTGLGSSSTFIVGLLNALHAWIGEYVSPMELAEEAVKIEREILKEPGGKQDQYMASFGGIQKLNFYSDERVELNPVIMDSKKLKGFEDSLLLLYTGIQRNSGNIHDLQRKTVSDNFASYGEMVKIADEAYISLNKGDYRSLGKQMHDNWLLKKSLANGISDKKIDDWYERGINSGANGGKLIGAGGGGFLLFMCDPSKKRNILDSLPELRQEEFRFEPEGSRIIYVGR